MSIFTRGRVTISADKASYIEHDQGTGTISVVVAGVVALVMSTTAVVSALAQTFASLAGSAATFPIRGLNAAQGGSVTITGGTSSTSANAGGAAGIVGGTPGATGVGGKAKLTGGAGGATSGAGGAAEVTGGAGTAGDGNGGDVILAGGAKHGSGKVGGVYSRGTEINAQAVPAAKTVTAAITAAELVAGLITTTGATGPSIHQLPTGTQIDAELPGMAIGDSFDFYVINAGTGASDDATITVNDDVTIVGNPTVGSLTDATIIVGSGHFRARKAAANTYVVYRLA